MTTVVPRRRPGLERAIRTADRLFYEEGIHAVGVDRIAAEADVSKATLYTHFRRKDDLVERYLRGRSEDWQAHVAERLPGTSPQPAGRILAMFDLLGEWFAADGYRGCPFINAQAELGSQQEVADVAVGHRGWVRGTFSELARAAGSARPEILAMQLELLYDGAMVGAQAEPEHGWAEAARSAAVALLAAESISC
jgi:AcrR family transcriptional regulator